MAAALILCAFSAEAVKVKGNGNVITKEIPVSEYDKLDLGGDVSVSKNGPWGGKNADGPIFKYTHGKAATLTITMDENLFAAFFLWMLWKTIRLRQTLGRAVCLGGLTALGVQAVFSLLLNLGVPLFAASFPLVVGNTGTVLNMFFIGLMLSAFRDGAMPEERPAERLLTVPAVSWADGVLTMNFKGRTVSE